MLEMVVSRGTQNGKYLKTPRGQSAGPYLEMILHLLYLALSGAVLQGVLSLDFISFYLTCRSRCALSRRGEEVRQTQPT